MISDKEGLQIAYAEAKLGFDEGGVPIGAALVAADGTLLGKGRNMRVQLGSAIHHGETSALYNTGRLPASAYKGTGACLLYGISRVVIGENKNFLGGEAYLKSRGVEVVVLQDAACQALMDAFIEKSPELWNEDIGVEKRVYSKEAQ